MKKCIICFLLIFSLYSCTKEKVGFDLDIVSFIQSLDTNTAETARRRLALAKIVSLAFEDTEFMTYFKNNFGTASSRGLFFEELLLVKHVNDVVKLDGTTLKAFLNAIHDEEVKELFGNTFIDQILEFDNRVTIKLPDLFLEYEWDEKVVIPVVYGCYQARPLEDSFVGYFKGKAVDKKMALSMPDVFHVNVKASDDFVLLRSADLRDAFNDDLINYLPQLKECQHIYEELINASETYNSFIIVDLRRTYHKWQESCGFKGQYIDIDNCEKTCQRQCKNPPVRHYVLDHFTMDDLSWFLGVNTVHFQEAFSFLVKFRTNPLGENLPTVSVPIVRISELGLMYEVKNKGRQNKQNLPYLSIDFVRKPDRISAIPIKHHFADGDNLLVYTNATYIHYGDRFINVQDISPYFQHEINSALAVNIGTDLYEYCDKATTASQSGGFRWVFRY